MQCNVGIGYAIAERLGSDGATVVICSRGEKNVKEAAEALKKQGTYHHIISGYVRNAIDINAIDIASQSPPLKIVFLWCV